MGPGCFVTLFYISSARKIQFFSRQRPLCFGLRNALLAKNTVADFFVREQKMHSTQMHFVQFLVEKQNNKCVFELHLTWLFVSHFISRILVV